MEYLKTKVSKAGPGFEKITRTWNKSASKPSSPNKSNRDSNILYSNNHNPSTPLILARSPHLKSRSFVARH